MSTVAEGAAARLRTQLPRGVLRWWSGLATRERTLVLLMVAAVAGAATWAGWWEPLALRRAVLQERLPMLQGQVETLDTLAAARVARRVRAPMDTGQLQALLRADGLDAHVQIVEQGRRRVLEIHDAPTDALWAVLLPVLADPDVEMQELTLERTGGDDMAAARVTGRMVVQVGNAETRR